MRDLDKTKFTNLIKAKGFYNTCYVWCDMHQFTRMYMKGCHYISDEIRYQIVVEEFIEEFGKDELLDIIL